MKQNPELIDDENPEWTEEDFKKAAPFSALPASLQMKLKGLQKPIKKESATVEFDYDVLEAFRATGNNWQHQMNVVLKQWLQEHPLAHSN